jgi:hypothetical protein
MSQQKSSDKKNSQVTLRALKNIFGKVYAFPAAIKFKAEPATNHPI